MSDDDLFGRVLTVLAQSWAMIFTLLLMLAVANKFCVEFSKLYTQTEEEVMNAPP